MQNLLIETNSIFLLSNKLSLSLNKYIGVCKKYQEYHIQSMIFYTLNY